jgi:hypothetical protein
MDKDQSSSTGKEESTSVITPSKPSNQSWYNEAHDEQREVVLVLPSNDLVSSQVRNICNSDLSSWLDDHPPNVCPPETFVGGVWVQLGVGISVVRSVSSRPPLNRPLNGTSSGSRESVLKRHGSVVGSVSP